MNWLFQLAVIPYYFALLTACFIWLTVLYPVAQISNFTVTNRTPTPLSITPIGAPDVEARRNSLTFYRSSFPFFVKSKNRSFNIEPRETVRFDYDSKNVNVLEIVVEKSTGEMRQIAVDLNQTPISDVAPEPTEAESITQETSDVETSASEKTDVEIAAQESTESAAVAQEATDDVTAPQKTIDVRIEDFETLPLAPEDIKTLTTSDLPSRPFWAVYAVSALLLLVEFGRMHYRSSKTQNEDGEAAMN